MLILRINSYQKEGAEQPASMTLGEGVLTIGRGDLNDWTLSDPDRILSKQHCLIEYKDGNYVLSDTSTNGVFHNSSTTMIGRGKSISLGQDDIIRVSDYEITVDIESPQAEMLAPVAVPETVSVPEPAVTLDRVPPPPPPPAEVLPEDGDWKSILEEKPPAVQSVEPDLAVEVPEFTQSNYEAPSVGLSIPEDWGTADAEVPVSSAPAPEPVTPVEHVNPSAPPPSPPSPPSAPSPREPQAPVASVDNKEGDLLRIFLEGAGLDPDMKLENSPEELMMELGSLFRKATMGLMGILAARGDIKSEFRLSQTMIKPTENNPLKFSLNIDEAMIALINKKGAGYMTPDTAFEEAFDDLKAHQVAVLSGMQSALQGLLGRFDPKLIQGSDAELTGVKKILGGQKAKHWDDFVRLYTTLSRETEDDFQNIFGREFAKAYEEQIHNQKTHKID